MSNKFSILTVLVGLFLSNSLYAGTIEDCQSNNQYLISAKEYVAKSNLGVDDKNLRTAYIDYLLTGKAQKVSMSEHYMVEVQKAEIFGMRCDRNTSPTTKVCYLRLFTSTLEEDGGIQEDIDEYRVDLNPQENTVNSLNKVGFKN